MPPSPRAFALAQVQQSVLALPLPRFAFHKYLSVVPMPMGNSESIRCLLPTRILLKKQNSILPKGNDSCNRGWHSPYPTANRIDIGATAQLRERIFGVEQTQWSRTLVALAGRLIATMTRRANQQPIALLRPPSRSTTIICA